jgi:hypothetical protein
MANEGIEISEALRKVELAFKSMKYGEIAVKVRNGKPIFVDKLERERVG